MRVGLGTRALVGVAVGVGLLSSSGAWSSAPVPVDELYEWQPGSLPMPLLPGTSELTNETLQEEPYIVAFNAGNTAAIVNALAEVSNECASVPSEYRIDCLAQGLRWASGRVTAPDYAQANAILSQAGSQLANIATRNLDPARPQLQADTSDNRAWKRARKYRPIKQASLRSANAEAQRVIDDAVAKLIRAAGSGGERRAHYTKIATALQSTKTLLRSS